MQPTPSRRQVLQGCVCLGLAGMLGGRWAGYAQAADKPPAAPAMQAHEAAPGCWYVEGLSALGSPANKNFISNAGFIVTSTSVVVVDALGSPALAERLLAEIARVTDKPVSHVIVTHYHADHVYGLQVFADRDANSFVRYPYIPGMNDDQVEKIAEFLHRWQQIEAELLPYHKLGNSKYRALEAQNVFEGTVPLKDEVEMLKKKRESTHCCG